MRPLWRIAFNTGIFVRPPVDLSKISNIVSICHDQARQQAVAAVASARMHARLEMMRSIRSPFRASTSACFASAWRCPRSVTECEGFQYDAGQLATSGWPWRIRISCIAPNPPPRGLAWIAAIGLHICAIDPAGVVAQQERRSLSAISAGVAAHGGRRAFCAAAAMRSLPIDASEISENWCFDRAPG